MEKQINEKIIEMDCTDPKKLDNEFTQRIQFCIAQD